MCLGVPMRIVECEGTSAICVPYDEEDTRESRRRVELALLGVSGLEPGALVLVHVNTAIRTLDDEEARLVAGALAGLAAANLGLPVDDFFADLVDREPELPEHLRGTPSRTT